MPNWRDETTMVELELDLINETDGAYLLSNGDREEWVSKSICTTDEGDTFTMPEFIALDRGWL